MLAKKPKGAVQKRTSSGISGLMWMFVGIILTLMIGFGLYLWNPLYKDEAASTSKPNTVQRIDSPTGEGDEYEFYDLLPEQEITGLPEDAIDALIRDALPSNEADALEPDFVVNAPAQNDNGVTMPEEGTSTIGTIANGATNPEQALDGTAGTSANTTTVTGIDNDSNIIIVEEPGTYDDTSAPAANSTAQSNSAQTGQTSQHNTAGTTASSANATSPNNQQRTTYILQINSYGSAEEADKRRAQVILAGIDARVVIKRQPNGQILYQVVSNQMTDRQTVIAKQLKLQNNGIDSLIVEQRHS